MTINVEEKKEEWENIKKSADEEEKTLKEQEEDEEPKKSKQKKKAKKLSNQVKKRNEESELAVTINQLVYNVTSNRCATDELKYEHIEKINIGGSVTNLLNYYFPSWDINHPIITLTGRVLKLLKLFTKLCFRKEVIKEEKPKQESMSNKISDEVERHMAEYLEKTK